MLNTDGLKFPLPTKDIPRFEVQNPTVSINVLLLSEKGFLHRVLQSRAPTTTSRKYPVIGQRQRATTLYLDQRHV